MRKSWSKCFEGYAPSKETLKTARKKRLPSLLKRSKSPMEAVPLEETDQLMVAQWLDLHSITWCHVPNGGFRHVVTAMRLRAQGVKAGVPDCLIFQKPPAYGNTYVGLALELKRKKGGVVSKDQEQFMEKLKREGWLCVVANGSNQAFEILESCGYGKRV